MRTLAALLLIAIAALGFAAPARADQNADAALWVTVHDLYNINITKHDALIQAAAVCAWLEITHKPFALAALQVLEMHPDWSATDAGRFAGAATGAYCPEYGPSTS